MRAIINLLYSTTFAGVLLILSVPLMYDKHQHRIDEKLCLAHKIIPLPSNKEKKTQ